MNHARFARRRAAPAVDIAVSHPRDGRILVTSRYFFADPAADVCRQFVGRLFEVEEVRAVEIPGRLPGPDRVLERRRSPSRRGREDRPSPPGGVNGHRVRRGGAPRDLAAPSADRVDGWRVERHGPVLSTWQIVHELPGRIRFRNRLIRRDAGRCAAIDAALARVAAIHRHTTNPVTATVLVHHDPTTVPRRRLLQILDRALFGRAPAGPPTPLASGQGTGVPHLGRRARVRRQGDPVVAPRVHGLGGLAVPGRRRRDASIRH